MKTRYSISYRGATGKVECVEIEATNMGLTDGSEGHDLAWWTLGKRTVFAIPFRSLIVTRVVTPPIEVSKSKNSRLSLCS